MRIEETPWVSTLNIRNPAEITKYFIERKEANFRLIIVIVPSATDTTYSKQIIFSFFKYERGGGEKMSNVQLFVS